MGQISQTAQVTPGLQICMDSEGYAQALPDGSCRSYWDAAGCVWTIGFGSTGKGIVAGLIWSREQAEQRLLSDWQITKAGVLRASPCLSQPEMYNWWEAITDFAYNEGVGRYQGSSLRSYVNRGDLQLALKEFPKWNLAGGKVLPGLVARRAKEQHLAAASISSSIQPSSLPVDSTNTSNASSFQGLPALLKAFFRSLFGLK